jgi:uncharacterized protein with FMN-binding domain
MKRISYWALSTISAVVLLFGYGTSTSGPMAGSAAAVQSGTVVSSSLTTSGSASTNSSGSDKTAAASGGSTTKTTTTAKKVVGSVASTQWGPVQVELTVKGGTITKVSVLQYPSGNGRDAEINSYALPILTKETIDAQSASIDMVSGATVTSGGYVESLQSALDQAQL